MTGAASTATSVSPISLILTSAAVAALVTSIITLLGQWLERRSRRRELLLSKAIELGIHRSEFIRDLAKESNSTATFHDTAVLAEGYYRWLAHLLDNGALPADAPTMDGRSRAAE